MAARFLGAIRFLLRDHAGSIEAFAAVMAVNSFPLIFVPTFGAGNFWDCRCCGRGRCHSADSFFDLVGWVDVLGGFGSLLVADFSPPAGAGFSFFAASW